MKHLLNKQKEKPNREFQAQIADMIDQHRKAEISFNQFINLLAEQNIKFYSPQDFKRINRVFAYSINLLPTQLPFEYLEYHSSQKSGSQTYILVKIAQKKLGVWVGQERRQETSHQVDNCMADWVVIMRRRYGNEVNWFKVLGGMTVAISIQTTAFADNLKHILKNTVHRHCWSSIVEQFLVSGNSRTVMWNNFMEVTKKYLKKVDKQKLKPYSRRATLSVPVTRVQTAQGSRSNITSGNPSQLKSTSISFKDTKRITASLLGHKPTIQSQFAYIAYRIKTQPQSNESQHSSFYHKKCEMHTRGGGFERCKTQYEIDSEGRPQDHGRSISISHKSQRPRKPFFCRQMRHKQLF